jgi:hypothetical protein
MSSAIVTVIPKGTLTDLYVIQGLTMKEIGEQLDRSPSNILYWLRKHSIETRPVTEPEQGAKYAYNEDFFKVWSPEMSWVLGLMFADGNVIRVGKNGWRCTLPSTDQDMLLQVAALIGTDAPVKKHTARSIYSLTTGRFVIGNDLIALGCVPKKSRIMQFPDVPNAFLPHFIRGLWDGDGCIFVRDRTRKPCGRRKSPSTYRELTMTYVSGSKDFVVSLRDAILAHTNIDAGVKERTLQHSPFYTISYYHRNSLKVLPWMYQSSTPQTRLNRKYQIAKEFLG